MNLAERNEFIKASPAIQVQSRILNLQRKAWNVLLANAYDELPNKEIHQVSIVDMGLKLGFDSGNMDYLKEVLEGLVDCTVKWNILEKDKEVEWGVASLLASAKIRDGICTYSFAPELRYKLYNPRIYAKLNLHLQNKFKSQYGLILWEICFDYFDRSRGEGETPFISLENFKMLMGLEQQDYPDFKVLNRNVIKGAIKEINGLTNFYVEVEQKRIGRKVAELKFRITRVKQLQNPEPIQESLFPDIENLPPVALELVQANVERQIAIKIAETEWEFVNQAALPEPGTYPDFQSYVEEKIELSLYASNVKNRGGFIVEAIRNNYQNPEIQKHRDEEKARERQALFNALKAERDEKVSVLLQQAVREQPYLLEAAAEKSPNVVCQRIEDYDSVQAAYENDGGMITGTLNGILEEEFCADLIAHVQQAYEDEKARIMGEVSG